MARQWQTNPTHWILSELAHGSCRLGLAAILTVGIVTAAGCTSTAGTSEPSSSAAETSDQASRPPMASARGRSSRKLITGVEEKLTQHLEVAGKTLHEFEKYLGETGQHESRERLLRILLSHLRDEFGDAHPHTLINTHRLALLLHSQQRVEEATALYEQTLRQTPGFFDANNWFVRSLHYSLGVARAEGGDWAAALGSFQKVGADSRSALFGPRLRSRTLERLAQCHLSLAKIDPAGDHESQASSYLDERATLDLGSVATPRRSPIVGAVLQKFQGAFAAVPEINAALWPPLPKRRP